MVNHAREFAASGFRVCLIGYREREFTAPKGVDVQALPAPRRRAGWSLLSAGLRMTRTGGALLAALLRVRPDVILVQNPPSFPTLIAAWIAARTLGAQYTIDWHNYGYSMLALRIGARHAVTSLAAWYEGWMARRADSHFCVSRAMQAGLDSRFGVAAHVLYDRPLEFAEPRPQPGPRVVCPSGWTADEDLDVLLDSLDLLGASCFEFHVTGDGPRRGELEPRLAELRSRGLTIHTGYLEESEYRALVASAALGLSMHRSSSGLDLPMKIVDLFAAGVPVCALDYGPVLREQVSDGETGLFFRNAGDLAALLKRLEHEPGILERMRYSLRGLPKTTWAEEWTRVAAPVFGVSHGS
jgi:beta-1,4-mannosyltransferase